MAILHTKRSIEAEKTKMRYMLTEIIDNVNPDGTLKDSEDYENSVTVPIPWSFSRSQIVANLSVKSKAKGAGAKRKAALNKSEASDNASAAVKPVKKRGRKSNSTSANTNNTSANKRSKKEQKIDVKDENKPQSSTTGIAEDDVLSFQKLFSPTKNRTSSPLLTKANDKQQTSAEINDSLVVPQLPPIPDLLGSSSGAVSLPEMVSSDPNVQEPTNAD